MLNLIDEIVINKTVNAINFPCYIPSWTSEYWEEKFLFLKESTLVESLSIPIKWKDTFIFTGAVTSTGFNIEIIDISVACCALLLIILNIHIEIHIVLFSNPGEITGQLCVD